ncbi:hypothetical protein AAFF_G00398600 [Aldrovandia affinis]|uniref:Reverse transcriptase/retrotransposon-derived protein RNase H-like domain-containing protein n=1 Tax=Aldrovandia affinis TaxID=143900 RepID=A0AAD7WKB2_9TELE|nr:hypothetical protein AAFF_G00398600 [Aldrovandia affinis]
MERVLSHGYPSSIADPLLLVHAGDFEGALLHLREVFATIRQAGLHLNPKKCQLFRRETAFLGHVVSTDGVATDPAKIAAVRDWPPPTNVSDLLSFLGLASSYRRYVQDSATIARPLHRLTDRGQPYVWDDPCAQAFNILQTALITAPVLAYPDANRPFILDTDASNVGVDAILSQPRDSGEQEARAQLAPMVATLRTIDGEAGCLPLSPVQVQVQEEQECDVALTQVRSWLAAGVGGCPGRVRGKTKAGLRHPAPPGQKGCTPSYGAVGAGLVRSCSGSAKLYIGCACPAGGGRWFYTKTGWPRTDPWHRPLPKRQVSRPDPFPPKTLLVRLGEAGGEPRGSGMRRHI